MGQEIEIIEVGNSLSEMERMQRNFTLMTQATKSLMVDKLDFGVIPGVSKPSLFKPGAEKLRMLFAFETKTERTGETLDLQAGFYDVTYLVSVFDNAWRVIAQCEWSCNTYEDKYRWRMVDAKLPDDPAERARALESGEYRSTKYGTKKRVANPDVIGLKNTIQKMAQKRAFVGAILIATGASQFYTQDVEDMPEFAEKTHVKPETKNMAELPPKPMDAQTREDVLSLLAELQQADPELTVENSYARISEKFWKPFESLSYAEWLQLRRSLRITIDKKRTDSPKISEVVLPK